MWVCAFVLAAPLGSFVTDELNTIRGNLKDEMMISPNVVGDRVATGKHDWTILAPVMASDDVIHTFNALQRFCMEHNGGMPHGAESHVCDMRIEVWPSVPMYYIYPTDGPGALNPGWGSAVKYKRRAESLFLQLCR
jgi:hypothetical protein